MSPSGDDTGPSTPAEATTLCESRGRNDKSGRDDQSGQNDNKGKAPTLGAPSKEADLSPGDTIGEYQITHLLGRGGMSVVYAGINPMIGKRVAIKVLLAKWSRDEELIARFFQEARAVNQIGSDYIIDIFGFDQLPDGRHYLVMDLIDGVSLDALITEQGVLSPEVALPILICVAHALTATHGEGIVHRDLKPHNIMVIRGEDGSTRAKILDFGVAKLLDQPEEEGNHLTRTGASIGTPMYMSPEQIRGKAVDHRSDIYALGVLMYQMFTGQMPFIAETYIDLANQHLSQAPPHPRQLNKALPGDLEALILRCLEKKPENRPGTMEEMLEILRELRSRLILSSSLQSSTPVMLRGPALQHRTKASRLLTAAAAFLLGILGTALFFHFGSGASLPGALPRSLEASPSDSAISTPSPRSTAVTLMVSTNREKAVIKLDGQEIGQGKEVSRSDVAAGSHLLEIFAPDVTPISHPLDLKPGAMVQLYFKMAPRQKPAAAALPPRRRKQRPRARPAALPLHPSYDQVQEAYEGKKWRRTTILAARLLGHLPDHMMKNKVMFFYGTAACQLGDRGLAKQIERKLFYSGSFERRQLKVNCAQLGVNL